MIPIGAGFGYPPFAFSCLFLMFGSSSSSDSFGGAASSLSIHYIEWHCIHILGICGVGAANGKARHRKAKQSSSNRTIKYNSSQVAGAGGTLCHLQLSIQGASTLPYQIFG